MDSGEKFLEGGLSEHSEPLLKKTPVSDVNEQDDTILPDTSEQYSNIRYNYGPRPFRDIGFSIAFALFVLCSFAFGIFAIAHHNSNYGKVDSALYNSTSGHCYVLSLEKGQDGVLHRESVKPFIRNRKLIPDLAESYEDGTYESFNVAVNNLLTWTKIGRKFQATTGGASLLKYLIWTLVVTFILAVPLVFGMLWFLKAYAKQLVYACLPFFILIPVFLNIYWFVACALNTECSENFSLPYRIGTLIFVFILCGIFAWIIYAYWDRVELTIKIMQMSAEALVNNMGLLLILPLLSLAFLVYVVPFVVFLIFAYMNGEIVPSSSEVGCVWKLDSWVPAYYTLAIFTFLWSAFIMAEIQVYTISATISQWYFAPSHSHVHGSIKGSLRHAFGSSFGSICFSGLILAFVRIIRSAIDTARSEQAQMGCFYAILRCFVDWILSAIEFLNKFTISFVAITGESFCASAKMSYDLLRRNLLSAVFVETISTRLLGGIVFVLSIFYAILVCVVLKVALKLGEDAYLVTAIAWLFLFVILFLFSQILDNVIDTVYTCYAIDKDSTRISKPEVHDVYVLLPMSRGQPPSLAIHRP